MTWEKQRTYVLTEYGKALKWSTFRTLGGGGLYGSGPKGMPPERLWTKDITLGEVVEHDIVAERGVARSCINHLKMPELAMVEVHPTLEGMRV